MADRLDSFGEEGERRSPTTEVAPLAVDGVLYVTTPYGQAVALDGVTGREIWKYTLSPVQGRPETAALHIGLATEQLRQPFIFRLRRG